MLSFKILLTISMPQLCLPMPFPTVPLLLSLRKMPLFSRLWAMHLVWEIFTSDSCMTRSISSKIVPLVSHMNVHEYSIWCFSQPRARISIYWSEIKEWCCAIIGTIMAAIGDPVEIAKIVYKQLLNYTYTYPRAPGVSIHLTLYSVWHYVIRLLYPNVLSCVHGHTAIVT